eukprot:365806-Chlamydomonas_euryale.AAC.3
MYNTRGATHPGRPMAACTDGALRVSGSGSASLSEPSARPVAAVGAAVLALLRYVPPPTRRYTNV